MILACSRCGRRWEGDKVPFREVCPGCQAHLHSCLNCRQLRGGRCAEPAAEQPRNRTEGNWCEWFAPALPSSRSAGAGPNGSAREKAEAAWKKLTNPGSKGERR